MIRTVILMSLALVVPNAGQPVQTPVASQAVAPAQPAPPASAPNPAIHAPVGDDLTRTMQELVKSESGYSAELSAMVEAFPSYAPRAVPVTGKIRVVGSDTMGPLLANIGISYQVVYPDAIINIDQGGTSKGISALRDGLCDIASVARELTAAEISEISKATGKQVFVVPIARGAVCVYVNADNPIVGLTKEQCNGLFSITHSLTEAPIMRWNELDPASPLEDAFPPLYVPQPTSGTLRTFIDWCMPGEQITTIGRFTEPGPSSIVNACCAYKAAIGISGFANRQPRARGIALSSGSGQPLVAPSVASICDGTYPLSRPLTLVFVAADPQHIPVTTIEFLRFVLSEDGQDLAAQTGNIPMDAKQIPEFLGKPVKDVWQ